MLTDEIKGSRRKSVVVPRKIDVVHELRMQYYHVTYRAKEESLGVSMTSKYKKSHKHLAAQKVFPRWIPRKMTRDLNPTRVNWCQKNIKKYNCNLSKAVYNYLHKW